MIEEIGRGEGKVNSNHVRVVKEVAIKLTNFRSNYVDDLRQGDKKNRGDVLSIFRL